ncbi:hypothetical protein HHI36_016054 [Cryptolaemus montrouzieri]
MPRHEICSNIDPLQLKEINLSLDYPSLKHEGNFCKYSYTTWCPCEKTSSRTRSQSECLEPCKKKSKDMKLPGIKRYLDTQQFENMDFEYEIKDGWFEKKQHQDYDCCRLKPSISETKEHQYFECCNRIRTNLCELPTSYIRNTNNCQTGQPMSSFKMSECDKDYVECLENRVKTYEKTIKYVEYTENSSVLENEYEKSSRNLRYDDRLQRACEKLEGIQSHLKAKCNNMEEFEQTKANSQLKINSSWIPNTNLDLRKKSPLLPDNHDMQSANERDKYCQTESNYESVHSYNCPLSYETETYFDKQGVGKADLSNLYTEEMNILKEKLKQLRNSTYKNNTSAKMVAESLVAKDKEIEKKEKSDKIVRNSPRLVRRMRPKLIRVKTRGGRINTIKIRRSNTRTVINQSSKSSSVESEGQSDYSDSDESIKETEEDYQVFDIAPEDSASKDTIDLTDAVAGAGDSILWPIRESLFPNVPPYIAFSAFNLEESRNIPIGRKFFKWKLSTITPVLVRKVVSNSGFVMVRKSNQWLGTWGKHIKSPMFKTLKDSQKLNHFPGTFQLGRKDRLWRNFQRMINTYGHKEFGFLPHTYVLPHELKLLKYNWENKNSGGDWWIIKPPASARGVGIRVINKWAQLPKKTSLVVQKYITNPYLINGSKFDLRLYVLVTSFHPLRVYLYSEGLVRFASAKYSHNAKDIKEKYMHLTNYSINKLSSNYTANEDAHSAQGHKWTITKLLEYLGNEGVDTKTLWRNLELLVVKTMIACEPPITELCAENMNTRYNCYEIFGIDVLLDSKLKPWLLEVNISPSLHSSSPLDEHVKGPMVQTLFNMAQFHFPTRLAALVKTNLKCYEPKLYTTNLTQKEVSKHNKFMFQERRQDYLETILENLTGDDIRHLIQAEDEYRVKDKFKRIFPTASTYKLLDFMEPRYYNRLFDAWETKYENNRERGIERLQALCNDRIHLKAVTLAGLHKNGQTTNRGAKAAFPKEKSPPKDVQLVKVFDNSSEVTQTT